MKNLIKIVFMSWVLTSWAQAQSSLTASSQTTKWPIPSQEWTQELETITTEAQMPKRTLTELQEIFGMTYFSYFYGPGMHPEKFSFNPNQLGLPQNDGNYFQNQLSIRYKVSKTLALDLQTRFNIIINNNSQNPNFSPFRWQTPRIGISGALVSGKDWSIVGAVNTDFPYFFPVPFSGYQSGQRRTVLTPGVFASFKYLPTNSHWSVFSVISPRFFIYADRNAVEPQYVTAGFIPQNKPEFVIAFQPTINYKLCKMARLTVGTTIDYRKQVISSWNIFQASLVSNSHSTAWRFDALPVYFGITVDIVSSVTIFPFITTYPIAIQRMNASTGVQATLLETTSVGMWLYGTLF